MLMDVKVCINESHVNRIGVEALIGKYNYGRYCEDRSLPVEQSRRLVVDRLWKLITQPGFQYIAAYSLSEELLGLLLFRLSEWDSEHFGYNVAVIESIISKSLGYEQELEIVNILIEKFFSWCETSKIRFVSVRVPALNLPVIHSMERWGFNYIENWIFNKFDLSKLSGFIKPPLRLRLARQGDLDYMLDYSKDAFSTQRFHADAHITCNQANSLYHKWILTAYNDPNQEILVCDIENKPAALMIYYRSDLQQYFGLRFAMWKMALLDPQYRSKGLGKDFFVALLYHHQEEDLNVVDSGLTTRNIASLNLHTKLNFEVITTLVTFHRWFPGNTDPALAFE